MSKKPVPFMAQFTIALLVTGNLIGAGILGIPVIAGICGVIPAIVGMIIFCIAMYYTACILADETIVTKSDTFNYPSLYHNYLGSIGKWIAVVTNMLILYGLLTAYLAGGSTIIVQILGLEASPIINVVFFLLITLLTIAGMAIIRRCNAALIFLLWVSFVIIVVLGAMRINPENYNNIYWLFLPVAIPVIVTSFHFHNIIPNVAEALDWDKRAIYNAMLLGMVIGFAMNVIWLLVGVGVIPLLGGTDNIVECYTNNIPATIPMARLIGSTYFMIFAMIFSIIAIITSYVANGLGLMGFTKDLLVNYLRIRSKIVVILITFIPPFVISLVNPKIFLKAINFVGGYGIVVLFGILPCIIALIKKDNSNIKKILAVIFLIIFSLVLLCQICLDTTMFDIELPHFGKGDL